MQGVNPLVKSHSMQIKKWQFWLGVLISILFIWLALRGLHLSDFWQTVQKANYLWLIPAIGVYFIGVWIRAWRWSRSATKRGNR